MGAVIDGIDWPIWREARRQQAETRLGPIEWLEAAQFNLGFGEDIFRPAHIRFKLLKNRNGVVDRDLQALYELVLELEQRFYTAQISLEKAREKLQE